MALNCLLFSSREDEDERTTQRKREGTMFTDEQISSLFAKDLNDHLAEIKRLVFND